MEGFPFQATNGKRCGSLSQKREVLGGEAKLVQGIAGLLPFW